MANTTFKTLPPKKGGFVGKFVALFMGILIGVIAGLGGLVAIGYWLVNVLTIRDGSDTLKKFGIDFDLTQFVGEDYLDKTAFGAVSETVSLVQGIISGETTFETLNEVSPKIGEAFGMLADTLTQYGVDTSRNELLALSVPALGGYLQERVNELDIAAVIKLATGTQIEQGNMLASLLYGKEGVHYVINSETQEIEYLPILYTLNDDGNFEDYNGSVYAKSETEELWTAVIDEVTYSIKPFPTTQTQSEELGGEDEEGEDVAEPIVFEYNVYQVGEESETLLYSLNQVDETNDFHAYANDKQVFHTGLTVGDIMSNNIMDRIQTIALADLMPLDGSSDSLMLTLAYGNGYIIDPETNKVTAADGTPTTLKDIMDNGSGLVMDLELAGLLGVDLNDPDASPIMIAIAFGNEGEDYFYNEATGAYEMYEGKTPSSIRDLATSTDLVNSLYLKDIIGVDETSSSMMIALAYGNEGTHYQINETTGKIQMLPIAYTLSEDVFLDPSNTAFAKEEGSADWTNANSKLVIKLEDGNYNVYELETDSETNEPVSTLKYNLVQVENTNVYHAYFSGAVQCHKPKSIKDLMSPNLVDSLYIKDLLNISYVMDDSVNTMMYAIAFGNEGEDYDVVESTVNGEKVRTIVMRPGKTPKTISNLMDSSFVENLYIKDLIGVDETSSSIMIALAYGKEGEDYTINPETGKIEMMNDENGKPKTPKTIKDLTSPDFIDGLYIKDVMGIDETSSSMMIALAYGNEGRDANDTTADFYFDENGKIVMIGDAKPKTIADLKDPNFIDALYIKDILGIDETSSAIMIALAYGNEGEDFNFVNGKIVMNEGKTPKTIRDLKGADFIDGLYIKDVMGISDVIDDDTNMMMIALAFGNEGVDFKIVEINNGNGSTIKKVQMIGNAKPKTVGELKGGNFVQSMYLKDVLNLDASASDMMLALAYGSKNVHFQVVGNKIEMLPISYTLSDDIFYDGNSTAYVYDSTAGIWKSSVENNTDTISKNIDGTYTLKQGDNTYTLKLESEGIYNVYDGNELQYYQPKTIENLMDPDFVNDLYVKDLLGISDIVTDETNMMMVALAFGNQGEDFELIPISATEKKIVMKLGKSPKTISSLKEKDGMDSLYLKDLLNIDSSSSAMMIALAYGNKNVNYKVEADGSFTMLPVNYLLDEDNVFYDAQSVAYSYNSTENAWLSSQKNDPVVITKNQDGTYKLTNNGVNYALKNELNGENTGALYYMYQYNSTVPEYYAPYTVGDFKDAGFINGMYLGDLLEMNGNTDTTMLALAYGKKGTDFKIVDGEIVMLGNSRPHTLNDLNGGCVQELPITSLITVEDTDGVTNFLLYGVKDLHYKWDQATHDKDNDEIMDNEEIEWLQKRFEIDHKGNIYNEYGDPIKGYKSQKYVNRTDDENAIFNDHNDFQHFHDLLVGTYILDENNNAIYIIDEVFTEIDNEDIDGNEFKDTHAHYFTVKNMKGIPLYYTEHTISDLSARTEHNALMVDITKVLTLGDIMGTSDDSSNIMKALKDWKIKDLSKQSKINSLTLGDILDVQDDSSKIMIALKDKTLGQLTEQNTINELRLEQILDLESSNSKLMDALKEKTIADLTKQETINELKLNQILDLKDSNSKLMEALGDKKISELTKQETINNFRLDQILDLENSDSKLMEALGSKPISDLTKQETIENLHLRDILNIGTDSPAMLKALESFTIADLNDPTMINGLNMGKLLGINNSSTPLLNKIAEWSLGDLTGNNESGKSKIDELTLGDVMTIDTTSPIALQNLKGATITNLGSAFNKLTLGEMIDNVESNTFLKHLSDSTVSTLSTDLEELTIQEVFMDQIYLKNSDSYFVDKNGTNLGYNSIDVVKSGSNYKVYAVKVVNGTEHYLTTSNQILYGELGNLYLDANKTQKYSGSPLESKAVLTGTWKYLLMNNGKEQICQLTQMTNLITNMTNSIQTASLNNLSNDGLISLDSDTLETEIKSEIPLGFVNIPIITENDSYYGKTKLGQLTVQELFDYVGNILAAINKISQ